MPNGPVFDFESDGFFFFGRGGNSKPNLFTVKEDLQSERERERL